MESNTTNNSALTLHPVDKSILEALAGGPLKASELKRKAQEATNCSDAQYYKRLSALKSLYPPKLATRRVGRSVYYTVPEKRHELDRFAARGGRLERHVVENASRILDELIRSGNDEIDNLAQQSQTLSLAVEALRVIHPGMPEAPKSCTRATLATWIIIGREMTEQARLGGPRRNRPTLVSKNWTDWIDTSAAEEEIMRSVWYLYCIEVLQSLKEI